MRNFNEIFRKDVTGDNVKSHKKLGLHPFSEKHISGKTAGGFNLTPPPPAVLGLKVNTKCHKSKYFHVIFPLLKYYQDQNLLI